MTSVGIKAEPSTSQSTLPSGMMGVHIKVEPNSPPPALLLVSDGTDVKVEPSSPPPTLLPVLDTNTKGTVGVDVGSNGSETSRGTMDTSIGRTFVSHQRVRSGKVPHVCLMCGRKFTKYKALIRHQRGHMGEKPYLCELCPSKFMTRYALRKHEKVHASGADMFRCSECDTTFTKLTVLEKHQRWHKMEKPHPCHLCPARFTTLRMLKNHVLRHTCEKPYTCPVCKSRFSWIAGLNNHIRQNHGGVQTAVVSTDSTIEIATPSSPPTALPPVLDATKFRGPPGAPPGTYSAEASRDIMDSIIRTLQGAPESSSKKPGRSVDSSHKCNMCGQCFTREECFKSHRNQCQAKHACSLCGKRFASRRTLVLHEFVHSGKEQYACPICGRKFAAKTGLNRHQHVHTEEKPYACEMCPSKFTTKQYLDRHKELHASGVDLFRCSECGMNFRKMAVLQRHLSWHKAEKPHLCHLCPARFARLNFLKDHLFRHTHESSQTCSVCEKAFSCRKTLCRHMRRVHGGSKGTVANTDSTVEAVTPSNSQTTAPLVSAMLNRAASHL